MTSSDRWWQGSTYYAGVRQCGHNREEVKGVEGLSGSTAYQMDPDDPQTTYVLLDDGYSERFLWVPEPYSNIGLFSHPIPKIADVKFVVWPWPDTGVPVAVPEVIDAIAMLAKQDVIEVACTGGHGRTGTLLAILAAIRAGWPTDEAISLLRKNYCDQAIETQVQMNFIEEVLANLRGEKKPRRGLQYHKHRVKGKTTPPYDQYKYLGSGNITAEIVTEEEDDEGEGATIDLSGQVHLPAPMDLETAIPKRPMSKRQLRRLRRKARRLQAKYDAKRKKIEEAKPESEGETHVSSRRSKRK